MVHGHSTTNPPALMCQGNAGLRLWLHGGTKEIFMLSIEETPGKGWKGGMKEEGTWWEEQRGKVPSCVGTGDGEES